MSYLLECAEGSKNGTTDPDTVLPLRRRNDLNLHAAWCKCCDLFAHTVRNTREHSGSTTEHNVTVQVLPDIHVTLHDRVVSRLVDSSSFHSHERRLEQDLRAPESLSTDGDHLPVGQLVVLLDGRAGFGSLHLLLVVDSNEGKLLLDVSHNFPLGCCGEHVTSLGKDLHEVVSKVTTSKVKTEDGVGERETLVDWHSVRHTITRIKHNTCSMERDNQPSMSTITKQRKPKRLKMY